LNPAAAGNSTGRKKIERKTLLFDYGFLIIKKTFKPPRLRRQKPE